MYDLTSILFLQGLLYKRCTFKESLPYNHSIWGEIFLGQKNKSYAQVLSQHALSGALDENGLSARQKGNRFAKAGSKCSGLKKSNQRWANLNRHKLIQDYPRSHVITVEALPIFSILAAIGNPIVDYFRYSRSDRVLSFSWNFLLALLEHLSLIPCSLDIEGSEEGVLETIPWQQVISGFCLLMVIKYPMDVGHYILSTNLRTIWNLNEINKERCFKLEPY